MTIEDKIFRRRRFDRNSLLGYGFAENGSDLVYETMIMNGDFRVLLSIGSDGRLTGRVIDVMNDDDYVQLRNPNYNGAFVGSVRQEYEELLEDISAACCTDVTFSSDQSNRIAALIMQKYGVPPDFPWVKDGAGEYGVFRHENTGKWFGLIMNIDRRHLDKQADGMTDVINLKRDPDAPHQQGVYPAYHMNHQHWISVILDGTLSDEAVMSLVDTSYRLTGRKAGKITEDLIRRVLEIADSVPYGTVITYGQIAAAVGMPRNARMIGRIMGMADRYGDHPCHRVVGHDGHTVPGWTEQRALLEAEGITFNSKGCVNMKKHNQ